MRARAQIKSHPIHPMLVAFPIGLWVASFIFDLKRRYAQKVLNQRAAEVVGKRGVL